MEDGGWRIIRRPIFRFLSFFLQLIYAFVAFWISTSCIVSLVPFLDRSQANFLPAYVWPNTSAPFWKWIVNDVDTFNQSWAICHVSSPSPPPLPSSSMSASSLPWSNLSSTNTSFHLLPTSGNSYSVNEDIFTILFSKSCLTDHAAHLYIIFFGLNLVLLVYHVVLLIFWPRIWKYYSTHKKSRTFK